MAIHVDRLAPGLGARVTGIDLSHAIDPAAVAAVRDALAQHGVLVFPAQAISDQAQVAFARYFGELGTFPENANRAGLPREIFRVANTNLGGDLVPIDDVRAKMIRLNWEWHTDSSYRPIPTKGALLRGIAVIDDAGDTEFANLVAAHAALPETTKRRIAALSARHSFAYLVGSQGLPALGPDELARLPPVDHPLVRQHRDGRQSLYLSPPYMEQVLGWGEAESRALVEELTAWATQDRFVYTHRWRSDDLIMWDNGWTMHRVTAYDYTTQKRVLHGTTLLGTETIRGRADQV